jgi:hypothetical protein
MDNAQSPTKLIPCPVKVKQWDSVLDYINKVRGLAAARSGHAAWSSSMSVKVGRLLEGGSQQKYAFKDINL